MQWSDTLPKKIVKFILERNMLKYLNTAEGEKKYKDLKNMIIIECIRIIIRSKTAKEKFLHKKW